MPIVPDQSDNALSPAKIALLYAIVGIVWLLFSAYAAGRIFTDQYLFAYSILIGVLLVLASAGMLYRMLHSHARRLNSSQEVFHQAELEIQKLAYYDRETGLPNHNLLLDRLNQVIALNSRKRNNTAVIYISLTGFKAVIDAWGHSGGSAAVCDIAERLSAALRHYDTVARIHRDEFVLVLGGALEDGDVAVVLNKLKMVFSSPLRVGTGETIISACCGVACFPADGVTSELLLQHAHIAMNQARQNGMPFQYFSEALNQKAVERITIETGLMRALEEGEFFLCYQPKMEITGTAIIGMEALVRWQRPGHGIVPPDKFIPVAEENGLIVPLGTWVLKEACRQNKVWQDAGLPKMKVAVNLAAQQLRDNAFVPLVVQILTETGLDPCYLELELTESALMGDSNDTVYKLLLLKELGISISVDDFGTGYSSLSYLKHLPIDTLKVDRSFVRDIVDDPDDAAIVDAIIAMARSLNLTVIAEGVETHDQLEFLRKRDCHQIQGYYFSRPLNALQFEVFVTQDMAHAGNPVSTSDIPLTAAQVEEPARTVKPPLLVSAESELACGGKAEFIGEISIPIAPAHPGDNMATVIKRFQKDQTLQALPVVVDGHAVGILNRATFLEEHIIGVNGFGFHINHSKKMRDLMLPITMEFSVNVRIREAAETIQAQISDVRVDNICVTKGGMYYGVVDVNRFISAITEINLMLAKGANPLTGLPGNESIQREINERLQQKKDFDIAYIDIDNFKPFNDYYGFQRGDVVIKAIGDIISTVSLTAGAGMSSFCGHIGGDDYIVITGPHHAEYLSSKILAALEEQLPLFHGEKDFAAGSYSAVNRKGEQETFGLLSISIGIVNTRLTPVNSYAQLASISTEVKKAAKKLPGSSVVINRRLGDE